MQQVPTYNEEGKDDISSEDLKSSIHRMKLSERSTSTMPLPLTDAMVVASGKRRSASPQPPVLVQPHVEDNGNGMMAMMTAESNNGLPLPPPSSPYNPSVHRSPQPRVFKSSCTAKLVSPTTPTTVSPSNCFSPSYSSSLHSLSSSLPSPYPVVMSSGGGGRIGSCVSEMFSSATTSSTSGNVRDGSNSSSSFSPSPYKKQRRRYQRRNSATSAMLVSSMSSLMALPFANDNDDDSSPTTTNTTSDAAATTTMTTTDATSLTTSGGGGASSDERTTTNSTNNRTNHQWDINVRRAEELVELIKMQRLAAAAQTNRNNN